MLRAALALLFFLSIAARLNAAQPVVLPPENALQPQQLSIIVNDRDALSSAIGDYYRKARGIPAANIFHVQFDPAQTELSPGAFAVLKRNLDTTLPASIQALALTWAAPYRVGCMSITSAFAFGYDPKYCASGCKLTARSPYFSALTHKPFDDLHMRPTMMLATRNFDEAKALIDRGVAADRNTQTGAAYLVETSDQNRSVRKAVFPNAERLFGARLPIHSEKNDEVEHAREIMFYFTGAIKLQKLADNGYLPGAMADHLTSFGGQLTDSSQMSALRWLEAGATGSYGTVVEPCAFLEKFPNPIAAMNFYLNGETLIEAYWKSVEMPGQGVFIGEPLARPFASFRVREENGKWLVSGGSLQPGSYRVWGSDRIDGDFVRVSSSIEVSPFFQDLELPQPLHRFYRLERLYPVTSLR